MSNDTKLKPELIEALNRFDPETVVHLCRMSTESAEWLGGLSKTELELAKQAIESARDIQGFKRIFIIFITVGGVIVGSVKAFPAEMKAIATALFSMIGGGK